MPAQVVYLFGVNNARERLAELKKLCCIQHRSNLISTVTNKNGYPAFIFAYLQRTSRCKPPWRNNGSSLAGSSDCLDQCIGNIFRSGGSTATGR